MITYLGLMCLTVLLVNATPIMVLRDKLDLLEISEYNSQVKNRFIELLSCPMCLGFWVGFVVLILSNTLWYSILGAAIISIGSELINKLLRK